jgi:hypothetical protein
MAEKPQETVVEPAGKSNDQTDTERTHQLLEEILVELRRLVEFQKQINREPVAEMPTENWWRTLNG